MTIKQIVITGVAGFIGSNLSEKLLTLGYRITGIDNFDDFYSKSTKIANLQNSLTHENFRFLEGDICDIGLFDKLAGFGNYDLIIHLAAKAGVRPSLVNPVGYYNVNVGGTLRILEFMRVSQIRNLIFASSSSVYGENRKVPFAEIDIVDFPISPYAATKKSGELLCYTYHNLYKMNISCLRFFTVYGPRQRPDLAIHKFTDLIVAGKPIPVYGDGNTLRDYTYIDDILDGIVKSIQKLSGYQIYNLGESRVISLNEMIRTLEEKLQMKALLKRMPIQQGDVHKTYADISKAKKELGYNPSWSFEDGIEEFIRWKLNRRQ